ncbi:hypothetical protein [Lewinella sp. LCG006]|uniref:hypothetical protein n=1 Tax=Lewinella sp. LCG006 TaxID=3231911 RepID=UPI00346120F6
MRNKIVLWGTDAADERILVALELVISENKVMIYTFSEALATDDFYQQMMENWRNDKEEPVVFPEGHLALSRELSITESILPEDIKVERTDLIQRAQTEWHFVVLSSKLSEAYRTELQELEEKLASLKEYDKEIWSNLKNFWGKVQQQMRDRTLLREHADEIKARTNKAFDALKNLRSKMDDEFRESSKENMQRFSEAIEDVEKRIKENTHLNKIFDELKRLQKDLRGMTFTKEHRNKLWQRIDTAFKDVKEKRFGDRSGGDSHASSGSGNSPLDRITSRYNGLLNAIDKMERSISRDEDDLAFQARQIDRTDGQLEAQIRQAKVQMIEQRVNSKKEKYEDMMKTKVQLEDKIEKEKAREAQRLAKQQEEAARREAEAKAKEKIAEDIRQQQEKIEQESGEQLASAAQAINEQKGGHKKIVQEPSPQETPMEAEAAPKAKATAPEESLLDAIGSTISESLEDVVDTVKAIAEVVADKIDKKVDDIKEDINDLMKEEEE